MYLHIEVMLFCFVYIQCHVEVPEKNTVCLIIKRNRTFGRQIISQAVPICISKLLLMNFTSCTEANYYQQTNIFTRNTDFVALHLAFHKVMLP